MRGREGATEGRRERDSFREEGSEGGRPQYDEVKRIVDCDGV